MSNSASILDQIAASSSQKEVKMNGLVDAGSPATLFGRHDSACAALTWGYYGGSIWVDGVLTQIANGTLSLTASSTNYIEASRSGGISFNTTGFTAGKTPLYTAVTSGSAVTSYTDYRLANAPFTGILSKSVAGSANVTLTAEESRNRILVLTGVLTGNIQLIVPIEANFWIVRNATTGAFTLTVIGATGTGQAVTQGTSKLVFADGTNIQTT